MALARRINSSGDGAVVVIGAGETVDRLRATEAALALTADVLRSAATPAAARTGGGDADDRRTAADVRGADTPSFVSVGAGDEDDCLRAACTNDVAADTAFGAAPAAPAPRPAVAAAD